MEPDTRTPLVLICGFTESQGVVTATANELSEPGTVVVRHDLSRLSQGIVVRTITTTDDNHHRNTQELALELKHGCISCTLREDLLPLLRKLHQRSTVKRIVLHLDPILEPESLVYAVNNIEVSDIVGMIDGPAGRDVAIEATVAVVDVGTFMADVTGDDCLDDRGISTEDERTVAQIVVAQASFADAIVVHGECEDPIVAAKTVAVLDRLAAGTPRTSVPADVPRLLAELPSHSRRGALTDAHDPLLRGLPPLDTEADVTLLEFSAERPFHPTRLHEAIDVLLDGVVQARGRLWLATQPDQALWLESAGGGLRVGEGGPWLAAMDAEQRARVDTERLVMADLRWDQTYGDRDVSLTVLVHDADPSHINRTLQWALVSDEEWELGQSEWDTFDDPFGLSHVEPCDDLPNLPDPTSRSQSNPQKGQE